MMMRRSERERPVELALEVGDVLLLVHDGQFFCCWSALIDASCAW